MSTLTIGSNLVYPFELLGSGRTAALGGHLFLRLIDDDGQEFVIEAMPELQGPLPPWGDLTVSRNGTQADMGPHDYVTIDLGGRDPNAVWDILLQHAGNIDSAGIRYLPWSNNSNAVPGNLLDLIGIDVNDVLPNSASLMLFGYWGLNHRLSFDYSIAGTDDDDILVGRRGSQTFTGGAGDDTLSGGQDDDRLSGGRGDDLLNGGTGDDVLLGGWGNDVLNGGAGRDYASFQGPRPVKVDLALTGPQNTGQGVDQLSGIENVATGAGNDRVYGDSRTNVLKGGAGDDLLVGRNGRDQLFGGPGDDILIGGAGGDRLTGGAGSDTFVFRNHFDSGRYFNLDRITDFTPGDDFLDFSQLGDTALALSFGATHSAGPEIRVVESGSGTRLLIDVDGHGSADLKILLLDTTGLSEADFLL